MIATVGAALVVVVVTAVALLSTSPRRGSFTHHDPSLRPDERFAWWGLQMLDGFGYAFPRTFRRPTLLPSPCDGDARDETEWLAAQLVLVSTEQASLVFDCLLLPNDADDLDGWSGGVPVTLRAHPSAGLTPVAEVDQALARWTATGTTVNIAMDDDDGMTMLRIADDTAVVELELEPASA